MNSIENLHYAMGELAYAVARADGTLQQEERRKFHDIVTGELQNKKYSFNISDIIFHLMDKDKYDTKTTYDWAMRQIRLNSHYLSPELKEKFIDVMEKVAEAFPPVSVEEKDIIERFKEEIEPIKGDPVYYDPHYLEKK
jgi:uncharacterized tellurite resistance protein B-like protein